jgi:tRNA A-37 threonylcarbamoyl transferase component Bud32
MAMTVTPAQAMRKLRADPAYRKKELEWQRQYYRRNRDAIRYVAKCREAGIEMTMAEAREILSDQKRAAVAARTKYWSRRVGRERG